MSTAATRAGDIAASAALTPAGSKLRLRRARIDIGVSRSSWAPTKAGDSTPWRGGAETGLSPCGCTVQASRQVKQMSSVRGASLHRAGCRRRLPVGRGPDVCDDLRPGSVDLRPGDHIHRHPPIVAIERTPGGTPDPPEPVD